MKSAGAADTRPDGRRSRWDGHRAARRADLIDAAIAVIAAEGPTVGMDRIAALAGTSKPVVYRYFADKADLYRAVSTTLVQRVLDRLDAVARAEPDPNALVRASVGAYLELVEAGPQLYRFVLTHPLIERADGEVVEFSSVVADLLATRLGAHLAASGLDRALARPWADAIVGFVDAAGRWWLDHPGAMSRTQLAGYLGALVWGGAAGVHQFAADRV